jgi:hypothetical protein
MFYKKKSPASKRAKWLDLARQLTAELAALFLIPTIIYFLFEILTNNTINLVYQIKTKKLTMTPFLIYFNSTWCKNINYSITYCGFGRILYQNQFKNGCVRPESIEQ